MRTSSKNKRPETNSLVGRISFKESGSLRSIPKTYDLGIYLMDSSRQERILLGRYFRADVFADLSDIARRISPKIKGRGMEEVSISRKPLQLRYFARDLARELKRYDLVAYIEQEGDFKDD